MRSVKNINVIGKEVTNVMEGLIFHAERQEIGATRKLQSNNRDVTIVIGELVFADQIWPVID